MSNNQTQTQPAPKQYIIQNALADHPDLYLEYYYRGDHRFNAQKSKAIKLSEKEAKFIARELGWCNLIEVN